LGALSPYARRVSDLHQWFAVVTVAANVVAAAWGGIAWSRGLASRGFWYALRVAQITVVVQVVIGMALVFSGRRPPDDLHYVYAVTPLFVALVTEALRVSASQRELEELDDPKELSRREQILLARRIVLREIGIMTIGLLLVVTLLLRALSSGGFVPFL
jgi:heme A synthase